MNEFKALQYAIERMLFTRSNLHGGDYSDIQATRRNDGSILIQFAILRDAYGKISDTKLHNALVVMGMDDGDD